MSFTKIWRTVLGRSPVSFSELHSITDIVFSGSSEADKPVNFIKGIASSHTILLQNKLQRNTKNQLPKILRNLEVSFQNAIVFITLRNTKAGKPIEGVGEKRESEK